MSTWGFGCDRHRSHASRSTVPTAGAVIRQRPALTQMAGRDTRSNCRCAMAAPAAGRGTPDAAVRLSSSGSSDGTEVTVASGVAGFDFLATRVHGVGVMALRMTPVVPTDGD